MAVKKDCEEVLFNVLNWVDDAVVAKSEVEVASVKKARVALRSVEKSVVDVAFVVVPFPAMKFATAMSAKVEEAVAKMLVALRKAEILKLVVVAPVRVSIEKIDEVAALSTLKARPFAGDVWMEVVA